MLFLYASDIAAYWALGIDGSSPPPALLDIPTIQNYTYASFVSPISSEGEWRYHPMPSGYDWTYHPVYYSNQQINQWLREFAEKRPDQKLGISLKDEAGPQWDQINISQFASTIGIFMKENHLKIVDIDAESYMKTNYVENFTDLIVKLRASIPQDALISYTCYTQSQEDKQIITQNKDKIDRINTMAYPGGFSEQIELFEYYAKLIDDPNKISIGVMSGGLDGQTFTSLDTVESCASWLKTRGYNKMMLWSLTRDVPAITGQPLYTWLDTIDRSISINYKFQQKEKEDTA